MWLDIGCLGKSFVPSPVAYAKVITLKDPAKRGGWHATPSSKSESRQVCGAAIRRTHVCAGAPQAFNKQD